MGTGPALRQLDSHRAIHDAAHAQVKELTEMVQQLFDEEREEDCLNVANVLIQYWEEKIIAHADAEDEGFYSELLQSKKVPEKDLYMLMRDHELFRLIIADLKEKLNERNKVDQKDVKTFHTLIILNEYHHIGEEYKLFPGQ